MSEKKLTLSEMATRYRRSEKTFKKYVTEYNLPFEPMGKAKLFDPLEVEKRLKEIAVQNPGSRVDLSSMPTPKKKIEIKNTNPDEERYARLLGLS